MIIMLEDDLERLDRFARVLESAGIPFTYARTAHDFITLYASLSVIPRLIALDHDLFVDREGAPDPGDGRDVAKYLAIQSPACPVLIHSTNAAAADSMLFTLEDADWTVDRLAPIGDDWIQGYRIKFVVGYDSLRGCLSKG